MPEQPDIEVSAFIPGSDDLDHENVPNWCDLALDIKVGSGSTSRAHLTRSAGEAIIEVLGDTLHPWSGKSIREMIWGQLDEVTARLLAGEAEPEDRGRAQGLAIAISILVNPLDPNLDAVREEALERAGVEPEEDEPEDMEAREAELRAMSVRELQALVPKDDWDRAKRLGKDALVTFLLERGSEEEESDDEVADDEWD